MNPSSPIPNPAETASGLPPSDDAIGRPLGIIHPDDPIARRGIVALADGRIEDAETHLRRIRGDAAQVERTSVERTWANVLEGMCAEAKGRLAEAERLFRTASTDATALAESDSCNNARVRALALERLGRVLRRMDDPVRADEAHRASFEIREQVGSWEECRQSAHELALDASVAGTHGDAIAWHQRALGFADALGAAGLFLRAETLSYLARAQRDAGDLDAAIQSAQQGLDVRLRLDPSSLETLRVRLELAEYRVAQAAEVAGIGSPVTPRDATVLRQSVPHPRSSEDGAPERETRKPETRNKEECRASGSRHGRESSAPNSPGSEDGAPTAAQRAISTLDAVIARISELREEFLAWGGGVEDERQRCEEALDFARRLRESSLLP